jgi:hypothetical protein
MAIRAAAATTVPRSSPIVSREIRIPSSMLRPWNARAERQLETARKVLAEEKAKAGATKAN